MKPVAMLIGVTMTFLAGLTIGASPALADGIRAGQNGQGDGRHDAHTPPAPASPFMRTYAPLPFNPRPVVQRPFVPSTFGSTVIVVPPPIVPSSPMGMPYGYDQSVGYGPDEMYGSPPSGPPPPAPPAPSVMQYP